MTYHDHGLAASGPLLTKDGADPFANLTKLVGEVADATMERIGKTDDTVRGLGARMLDVEQKLVRRPGDQSAAPESWGSQFVREGAFSIKELASSRSAARVSVGVKAVTIGPSSAGALERPMRDAAVPMPRRRLTIRQLLPVVDMTTGTAEYPKQTTRPSAAATVAETALKPESDIAFTLESTTAKVIAHWTKVSRQALEDLPQLRGLIDTELRYGLMLAEEAQLLNGGGTGTDLTGVYTSATPYAAPIVPTGAGALTKLDVIGLAMLQVSLADFEPTGIVLHPSDWLDIRLTKTDDGAYVLGDPQTVIEPRLFGLPVVPTPAMGVGAFLVGDFQAAATLYDRWEPRVEVGYVGDDFIRNLATLLAEERIALAVKQALALVKGDFSAALAAS